MHPNSHIKRVLDFLRKNVRYSYNAKTISRCLHLPENSVKVCLHRLLKKNIIYSDDPGFYQAYVDISLLSQLENPPMLLHGIMLECNTTEKLQKCMDGIPSNEYTDEALQWLYSLGFLPTTNYRFYKTLWYEGRKITITIHVIGKVDVSISSTKNPLSYPDFLKMLTYLDGVLDRFAPFSNRKVVDVLEVGVAKDYRQLRLDGVKGVALKAFTNAWARIYYKDDIKATRFEHHIVGRMSLDDVLKSLSIMTNPVNYRCEEKSDDSNNPSYG